MTKFCGHKTGFNPSGSNDVAPNESGPPSTVFSGRGALPKGKLKNYPSGAADISGSNRRVAKANVGTGGASTPFRGRNAFSKGKGK
jgi:hypothetical protein